MYVKLHLEYFPLGFNRTVVFWVRNGFIEKDYSRLFKKRRYALCIVLITDIDYILKGILKDSTLWIKKMNQNTLYFIPDLRLISRLYKNVQNMYNGRGTYTPLWCGSDVPVLHT